MAELVLHLVVQDILRLPGLGLLILPASPEPHWLLQAALHTSFTITILPNEPSSILGTVEEIAYTDQPPRRGLLLDFSPADTLPVGSRLEVRQADNNLH